MIHSGHEPAWRAWRSALAGTRMHHAWLLAGRRGIGKIDFALAAARELVAEESILQPREHPDIILLTNLPASPEDEARKAEGKPYQTRRNIAVDQIREMQRRLTTRPTLGERRAIIIFPADDLEKGAANALLKSLEEPPLGSYFLLVTHRPGRLLATVRSRCRMLRFGEATEGEIEALLAREHPSVSPETRALAIGMAEGAPGMALEYLRHDLAPLHHLMERMLREGDRDFALRGALAEAIGARPSRERQLAAIELARVLVSREMRRAERNRLSAIIEAHGALNRLFAQAPTHNFDPGLLLMEIGRLLVSVAAPREMAPH